VAALSEAVRAVAYDGAQVRRCQRSRIREADLLRPKGCAAVAEAVGSSSAPSKSSCMSVGGSSRQPVAAALAEGEWQKATRLTLNAKKDVITNLMPLP